MEQQMQPFCNTTALPCTARTSKWSIPISPNSLIRTAVALIDGDVSKRDSNVVLPLPRNPVRIDTGTVRPAPSSSLKCLRSNT